MRPRLLEMEGFGAFRDRTNVEFDDTDLFALVGATGAGKSTIIDAITFALYGSVARYEDSRLVAPAIHQASTRARVRLDFELSDETYTAVRVVQRTARGGATTKEARLERGDDVLADDARGMNDEIADLLGLDVDQFNRTVVLPQGRFADFLHDEPRERQKTLRQLLGMDIYYRIGQVARERAQTYRNQIEVLQPGLDEGSATLTDERRDELQRAVQTLEETRSTFATKSAEVDELQEKCRGLDESIGEMSRQLQQLAAIEVPAHVGELDQRLTTATDRLRSAERDLQTVRDKRRAAVEAERAGPDLVASTTQLARRRNATALSTSHQKIVAELNGANQELANAEDVAHTVRTAQKRLDDALEQSRRREAEARQAADSGTDIATLISLIKQHDRRAQVAQRLKESEKNVEAAETGLAPLTETAKQAANDEERALQRFNEVERRVGVVAYADLLNVGEPCPLCLEEVHTLPAHELDEEHASASRAVAEAKQRRREADQARDRGRADRDGAEARADVERRQLAEIESELSGAPPPDELREQQEAAQRRKEALANAVEEVNTATATAKEHREHPANVAAMQRATDANLKVERLNARATELAGRVEQLSAELDGIPGEHELKAAIARAEELKSARETVDTACDTAESEHSSATSSVRAIEEEIRVATEQLRSVRDEVAALRPPPLDDTDLASQWAAFSMWASDCHRRLDDEKSRLDGERTSARQGLAALESATRQLCADALGVTSDELTSHEVTTLGERLAAAEAEARSALAIFDTDRQKLADLRQRVEQLKQSADVAELLGHLLRADRFEGWLMESALISLVDRASVRLRELSGGQFSLDLVDRHFYVRDHGNADELRRARTLSGGETFLASLSLALALADATAELASENAPAIESIFLDEGFGSLDPETLDVVATAIEELGASGRIVGIVTHVRDLAERIPVRLEVTKAGTTSTVERIEA